VATLKSTIKPSSLALAFMLAVMPGFVHDALAQEDLDLSDNAVCLDCHSDMSWPTDVNGDRPRVHDDSGHLIQADHEAWSCTDCHTYITAVPHPEDLEGEVDCTNCHESTPG